MPRMPKPRADSSIEQQVASFLAKFEPSAATLIQQCRAELRKLMPAASELVYDNYNFLVFGFCSTSRPSSCIVSVAAAANGVGLSFYRGADLQDPEGLLQGSGVQNRFVRIPELSVLRSPGVRALIGQAVATAKVPLPGTGRGGTVVQSVSAKQRPRRKPERGI